MCTRDLLLVQLRLNLLQEGTLLGHGLLHGLHGLEQVQRVRRLVETTGRSVGTFRVGVGPWGTIRSRKGRPRSRSYRWELPELERPSTPSRAEAYHFRHTRMRALRRVAALARRGCLFLSRRSELHGLCI
jgi:hypothetical protein